MNYTFTFKDKEYVLSKENCEGIFFNDDEIENFNLELILDILINSDEVDFSKEYYTGKCTCKKQEPLNKAYCYLEYHFYIYTKDDKYIISTISSDYENTSFNKLFSTGKIDNSYIVSIAVCPECGTYSIEVNQCEV